MPEQNPLFVLKFSTRFFLIGFMLLCLFFGFSPSAVTAKTSDAMLQSAMNAYDAGDYAISYKMLNALFKKDPANTRVNYYLGRCAFELGDFETAIFAFDRMLIADPGLDRVKLEMARAYMRLGSFEMAEQLFVDVLKKNPPPAVQANIKQYLDLIYLSQKRNFVRGYVSVGMNWDDNVYVTPIDDVITIPSLDDLPVVVGEKKYDYYPSVGAGISHSYYFNDRGNHWKSSLQTFLTRYHDYDDLDVNYIGLNTGPAFKAGPGMWGVYATGTYMTLDNKDYMYSWGLLTDYRIPIGSNQELTLALLGEEKKFPDYKDKDGFRIRTGGLYEWVSGDITIRPSLYYTREDLEDNRLSYNRYTGRFYLSHKLPLSLSVYGAYRYQRSDYDDRDEFFLISRSDDLHTVTGGIFWDGFRRGTFSTIVSLDYVYEKADSNIELNEYDKNVIRATLTLTF